MRVVAKKRRFRNGDVFSRLTILESYTSMNAHHQWEHLVVCACGTRRIISGNNLRTGRSTSCGCLRKESTSTHGSSHSPEYTAWRNMMSRCVNPNMPNYKHYGGRGIEVCKEWLNPENFLRDMGRRPNGSMSLDRINNDGNYEPSNCRWATWFQQSTNKRVLAGGGIGIHGIRMRGNVWSARIQCNKREIYLGVFNNLFDAACARISAENKYHRPRML